MSDRQRITGFQLDLATAIVRIEQAYREAEADEGASLLVDRLATCDAPRLRAYLTAETLAALAEVGL